MNAEDIFRHGRLALFGCVNDLDDEARSGPGVDDIWPARDVAHLALYDLATGDIVAGSLSTRFLPALGMTPRQECRHLKDRLNQSTAASPVSITNKRGPVKCGWP